MMGWLNVIVANIMYPLFFWRFINALLGPKSRHWQEWNKLSFPWIRIIFKEDKILLIEFPISQILPAEKVGFLQITQSCHQTSWALEKLHSNFEEKKSCNQNWQTRRRNCFFPFLSSFVLNATFSFLVRPPARLAPFVRSWQTCSEHWPEKPTSRVVVFVIVFDNVRICPRFYACQ